MYVLFWGRSGGETVKFTASEIFLRLQYVQ